MKPVTAYPPNLSRKRETLADGARGMDLDAGDLLEDVDTTFDNNELKSVMELAMRMAEIVRSTSEWHRRCH